MSKKYFEVKLFVDGCSKGNPGKAGAGYVIKDMSGNIIKEGNKYLGNYLTNNQAEYKALIYGLNMCMSVCRKQLTGIYRIHNQKLKDLLIKIKNLERLFEKVEYSHINREKNKRADELANAAIKGFFN